MPRWRHRIAHGIRHRPDPARRRASRHRGQRRRGIAAVGVVGARDGARRRDREARPGTLWHDNLFSTGDYTVRMTLLKGQNATAFRLYENGSLIATVPLEYRGTAPQSAKVAVSGKKNGTYVYTGELINSKGVTATSNTTVKVTKALPATPVLSMTTATATAPSS